MAEQQITEQHTQVMQRMRSLFEMHNIPFGTPEDLGGLLHSIQENRHFAMDFWSLVNAASDSGSGTLNDAETLEAVVGSAAGVGVSALPAAMRPVAEDLRQLLAGVDISRPAELPGPIAAPADALLSRSRADDLSPKASPTSSQDDAASQRRRSIGDALAQLEQRTRDLRAQLAEIDAQISESDNLATAGRTAVAQPEPALNEIHISEERHGETLNKWNRMSPFGEGRMAESPAAFVSERREDVPLAGSPRAEVTPISGGHAVAKSSSPKVVPFHSAPAPQSGAESVHAAASEPVAVPVFDPKPPSTLGHRGLAIPDPDDDPHIKAPFSDYGSQSERSFSAKLLVPMIVLCLLAAGYAGATRTEVGREWLQKATDWVHSIAGGTSSQEAEVAKAPTETQPPVQPAPAEEQTASAPASSPTAQTPEPVTPVPTVQAPEARRTQLQPADSALRSRTGQQMVDQSVLRVPSSTMAANLITSRVPAYPEAARSQGIEGAVVMDIVISQTGMVKYVRVIDGDRHLRGAAEDAVLRWHYKPYTLNGQPVEVSTTVKLEFRLPQQ